MVVKRGFVDIAAGQAHYLVGGTGQGRPLVMLHASPGSAKMVEPLLRLFAGGRTVYAFDTLGNGDSSPPAAGDAPDLSVFVTAHLEAIDALGLAEFDLYGSHTGGNIACEIAIARPRQVRHLILDGMSLYTPEERADMLLYYAPPVELRDDGTHLAYLWNFVRDTFLFWPWYRRDAAHVRGVGLPELDDLHDKVVEVIKASRTFHLSYNAAIAYEKEARLPLVTVPTLLSCARTDMLLPYLDAVAALMPGARTVVTPGIRSTAAADETVDLMTAFLDDRNVA